MEFPHVVGKKNSVKHGKNSGKSREKFFLPQLKIFNSAANKRFSVIFAGFPCEISRDAVKYDREREKR
jgi:hypothetical protein